MRGFPTEQDLADGLDLCVEADHWRACKDALRRGSQPRFVGKCEDVAYEGIVDRILEFSKIHVTITEVEGKPL